jgi:hypothetical protein
MVALKMDLVASTVRRADSGCHEFSIDFLVRLHFSQTLFFFNAQTSAPATIVPMAILRGRHMIAP